MTNKYIPPPMKPPVSKVTETVTNKFSSITKLLPLICAGTAVGVSILALKELKKIKYEMNVLKVQQENGSIKTDPLMYKKMEMMEKQLNNIGEYLKIPKESNPVPSSSKLNSWNVNKTENKVQNEKIIKNAVREQQSEDINKTENKVQNERIIKNAVREQQSEDVNIINEPEDVEYEEVEVTDDESDEK